MTSLLITLIALVLVLALALAVVFYGGPAISKSRSNAAASTLIAQSEQIVAASSIFHMQKHRWPASPQELVDANLLTTVPTAPAATNISWSQVQSGAPQFWVLKNISEDVCRAVNKKVRGDDGVHNAAIPGVPTQCFGTTANYTVLAHRPANDAADLSVSVAAGAPDLQVSPSGNGWALAPTAPLSAQLVFSPASVDFGTVSIGSTGGPLAVTLANSGNASANLAMPVVEAPFSMTHDCPASLSPSGQCTLQLAYAPTTAGPASASVAVGGATLPLTGSGASNLVASVSNLDFVTINLNAARNRLFTLTNTGDSSITIPSMSGYVSAGSPFYATSGCLTTISPHGTCTISVSFFPNGAGAASHTLDFGQGVTIPLSGTAGAVPMSSFAVTSGPIIGVRSDNTIWSASSNPTSPDFTPSGAYAGVFTPMNTGAGTPLTDVVRVSGFGTATSAHMSAVKTDGTIWGAGKYLHNIPVGYGSVPSNAPYFMQMTTTGGAPMEGVSRSVTGGDFTVALKTDGTIWATGVNAKGQLGIGSTTATYRFTQMVDSTTAPMVSVQDVKAGVSHAAALKSDGTVWAVGEGAYGTLGTGSTANQTRFVSMTTTGGAAMTGVTAIAAGDSHTVALKGDGTVWATGYNGYGQLGDGTTTTKTRFVQMNPVAGMSPVIAVAAGASHTVVLCDNGTVWAVGYNNGGQLGNGVTTAASSFVQMTTTSGAITGAVSIFAGGNRTIVARPGGEIWAAGQSIPANIYIPAIGSNNYRLNKISP